MSMHHVSRFGLSVVTTFGLGRLRPAPGTWGSMPPVIVAAVLLIAGLGPHATGDGYAWGPTSWWVYHGVMLAILIAFCLGCMAWGDDAEAVFGKKDPGSVCADETAGVCIPLMFLPASALSGAWAPATLLLVFLSFRVFDILKLPPARGLQRHHGGVGILLDDLIAGVQAAVVVQLVTRLVMA